MSTSFIEAHLGKAVEEIDAQALIDYFLAEREETLTLEFKSYNRQNPDIVGVLKTVAAFLNSEGGLIVYGAPPEVARRKNFRVVQGDPTPIPTSYITKDGLVNKISDSISYMPVGIKVKDVLMPSGDFVYLIEVPESSNKPHQYDNRYPIRLDGQSRNAPHYLVEALFKQVRTPELRGFMRVVSFYAIQRLETRRFLLTLGIEVSIFNETKFINDTDVYLHIVTDTGRFNDDKHPSYSYQGHTVVGMSITPVITYGMATSASFQLLIDSDDLNRARNEGIGLMIVFGSRNSITRQSSYTVHVTKDELYLLLDDYITSEVRLRSLLTIQKDENKSMNEMFEGTEEQRRQIILKGI